MAEVLPITCRRSTSRITSANLELQQLLKPRGSAKYCKLDVFARHYTNLLKLLPPMIQQKPTSREEWGPHPPPAYRTWILWKKEVTLVAKSRDGMQTCLRGSFDDVVRGS